MKLRLSFFLIPSGVISILAAALIADMSVRYNNTAFAILMLGITAFIVGIGLCFDQK